MRKLYKQNLHLESCLNPRPIDMRLCATSTKKSRGFSKKISPFIIGKTNGVTVYVEQNFKNSFSKKVIR